MAENDLGLDPSRTNSEQLRDLANTFSDESQDNAKQKMISAPFRLDRGDVPFDETLINLSQARDSILRSVDSGAVVHIPLRIQRSLIQAAKNVSTQLTSMNNGTDAVLPFISAVDELIDALWISNLQNMSGEILGFHEKLNQLKALERRLKEFDQRAKSFESTEHQASQTLQTMSRLVESADSLKLEMAQRLQSAETDLKKIVEAQAASVAAVATTQQNEKSSAEVASSARLASSDLESLKVKAAQTVTFLEEAKIGYETLASQMREAQTQWDTAIRTAHTTQVEFFKTEKDATTADRSSLSKLITEKQAALEASVSSSLTTALNAFASQSAAQIAASKSAFDTEAVKSLSETKAALVALESRSQASVKKNETDIADRMIIIDELEKVFSEKIRLATNFQLFHSFDTRQKALAQTVKFWQNALFLTVGTSVVISLGFVAWILVKSPTYNAAFFLKLSFTIPLVYVIHFCSSRFSEERRLEEEYAFKSNISISLEPYRELVERLVNKSDAGQAAKYLDFVLASIDRIFSSPTQSVTKERAAEDGVATVKETTQGMSKVLESITGLVQSLTKLK